MTHLDDTYEGAGEHDGLVIAVALAGWRVLPVGRRKSLPNGCHECSLVSVKQGWGTWIIVEFNDCQGNVRVGSVRISRSGDTRGWKSSRAEPVAVTKRGPSVVVVMAVEEFERLNRIEHKASGRQSGIRGLRISDLLPRKVSSSQCHYFAPVR